MSLAAQSCAGVRNGRPDPVARSGAELADRAARAARGESGATGRHRRGSAEIGIGLVAAIGAGVSYRMLWKLAPRVLRARTVSRDVLRGPVGDRPRHVRAEPIELAGVPSIPKPVDQTSHFSISLGKGDPRITSTESKPIFFDVQ